MEEVPFARMASSGFQEAGNNDFGNNDFGTTRRRAGDANEIADMTVDGSRWGVDAPTASSGEGADAFRGGGESWEGAGQGEGMKKGMGGEAQGVPVMVMVMPVARVSIEGGRLEFLEEGFEVENALVAPPEVDLDGSGTWAQAEVIAGAGAGKTQEGEVWKQTPLPPRNAEAGVEEEWGGGRGRVRGGGVSRHAECVVSVGEAHCRGAVCAIHESGGGRGGSCHVQAAVGVGGGFWGGNVCRGWGGGGYVWQGGGGGI